MYNYSSHWTGSTLLVCLRQYVNKLINSLPVGECFGKT